VVLPHKASRGFEAPAVSAARSVGDAACDIRAWILASRGSRDVCSALAKYRRPSRDRNAILSIDRRRARDWLK